MSEPIAVNPIAMPTRNITWPKIVAVLTARVRSPVAAYALLWKSLMREILRCACDERGLFGHAVGAQARLQGGDAGRLCEPAGAVCRRRHRGRTGSPGEGHRPRRVLHEGA